MSTFQDTTGKFYVFFLSSFSPSLLPFLPPSPFSKQFEESQGRTNSKTAFYQALQNSLGGEDSDARILAAAVWYYSLEHSTDDYASFSRALENATR